MNEKQFLAKWEEAIDLMICHEYLEHAFSAMPALLTGTQDSLMTEILFFIILL